MFKKYDKYLSSEFSIDFWSDEGINQAVLLIAEFKNSDWSDLRKEIDNKPSYWLIRCAETLGDEVNEEAFNILLKLIQSKDEDVQLASVDSINSLASMDLDILKYRSLIIPILNNLYDDAGMVSKTMIENLMSKFTN